MWETTTDSTSGRTYWYDRGTGVTSWTLPPDFEAQQKEKAELKKKDGPVLALRALRGERGLGGARAPRSCDLAPICGLET